MSQSTVDLAIIGGGINGAGIAADAAGRGLSVHLVEQNDFASATSSASSKLIHGGLRYLEHYEFRLVREALAERERLLKKAPHIIHPMRFILPHRPHLRPSWMIRSGLFLYDHLSSRKELAGSETVHFDADSPLIADITHGFEYSDCWVDDARLVLLNLKAAQEKGAVVQNHTRCVQARPINGLWHLIMENTLTGQPFNLRARCLVNAAGPWAQSFLEEEVNRTSPRNIRLIKGSHIIVPKQYEMDRAFILQNEDKRVVFVIPYLNDFTLIGTTDKRYQGDPSKVSIDQDEIDYLLAVYNRHFRRHLVSESILSTYSGVRPLCDDESDDPSAMSRDYTLELESIAAKAPLLSIFGGKITTYRKLAEAVLHQLRPYFPRMEMEWTEHGTLPGGEEFEGYSAKLLKQFPDIEKAVKQRWLCQYGSRCQVWLRGCNSKADLGEDFGHGLYQKEVEYMIHHEWARSLDDVLKRRSKLYLYQDELNLNALDAFINRITQTILYQRESA